MTEAFDYKQLLLSQYVAPVLLVVGCVCIIFLFGFKRTKEPSFHYEDEEKRKKPKYKKVII